jgi:hypothetical protein
MTMARGAAFLVLVLVLLAHCRPPLFPFASSVLDPESLRFFGMLKAPSRSRGSEDDCGSA